MNNLVLQIDKGGDFLDSFVYDAWKSLEEYNWWNRTKHIAFKAVEPLTVDIIPVGSVEFVESHLKKQGVTVKPLNVPKELMDWNTREFYITSDFHSIPEGWYYKSNDKYKAFPIGIKRDSTFNGIKIKEDVEYFCSSPIEEEIIAEFRVFVLNGEVVDIRRYIGELVFLTGKDIDLIKNMVKDFTFPSYCMDIALTSGDQRLEIIECHHFYGCGNYGFRGIKYVEMLAKAYNELIKN